MFKIASLHDKTPDRLDFKGLVEEVGGARRVLKSISITNVLKMEVLTSDVLDNTYALLGTSLGLFFVDLTKAAANPTPIPLIRNIRFRQIEIVPQYNIMIALSGKHDQVRQYKLSSIRKLIKLFTGTPASELISKKAGGDMANYDINDSSTLDANKVNGAVAGPVDNAIDDEYKHLHTKKLEDDHVLVARWTSDYIKIVGSKDARVCVIQHTETSVFMGVLFKQDVTLYQWAKEPYLKFMKLRAFWLPEAPKSMHLIHDGLTITDLYLIYASEANIVSVDDSKVKELFVNPEYTSIAKSIKGVKNPRWQTFNQIPFHDVKRVALRAAASSGSNTVNRKLAAVAGKLMVDATNGGNQDRFFLSTYHSHTKVVDITAQPITGAEVGGWKNGVTWPDAPSDLVLRSMDYVISICKNTIVIADWITAQVIQEFKLEDSASMRVIGTKSGAVIVCVDRKKKGSVVYYLREPPVKPMTLPNTTTTAATATATATAARDSTSISPTSPQAASVDNELNTEMSSLQMSTQGSVKK